MSAVVAPQESLRSRLTSFFASRTGMILTGGIIGLLAAVLQNQGNPANMGVCMACFERDIAGALGLHRAEAVQYIRPEIIAFVFGSMLAALLFNEFRARTGSAPVIRFILGVFAMIGALVFLGCPWRALLRLAGGDLNAVVGLVGLVLGVGIGVGFLRNGYTLGRSYRAPLAVGLVMPAVMFLLLILLVTEVRFTPMGPIFFSESGPGSMRAPVLLAIGAGLVIGFLAQRTRYCTMGSVRDVILMRDTHLLSGVVSLLVVAFGANLVLGQFNLGVEMQPVAHSNHLWNFLGMVLSGLAYALAGGCPGRQVFLSGEGDGDATIFVFGMIVGAGFAHNFALAAVPDRLNEASLIVGGPGTYGQIAVIVGLVVCVFIGFSMRERVKT